ncbi:MAG: alginate export family protein [Planctomycetota bacterium]|nr:alginate export family protein [Planctomycetota bacterium]
MAGSVLPAGQGPQAGGSAPAETPRAGWLKGLKNPTSWLQWGMDLRIRWEYAPNTFQLDEHLDEERHYQRYRSRLSVKAEPARDVELNARLAWEFRMWQQPKDRREFDGDEAMFDILNFRLRNFASLPLTITAGRQEIKHGDGWLVYEGTPGDGTRTYFFDAIRLLYDIRTIKTAVDFAFICNHSDSARYIRPFNDRQESLAEENSKGFILYVTNKSLPQTQFDGYLIYKHDSPVENKGNDAEIYTFGGRFDRTWAKHWQGHVEGAAQLGQRNSADHIAFGLNSGLSYHFNDKLKNVLYCGYEFLSGDDPGTSTDTEFDPAWGRWSRFSSLYQYTQRIETRHANYTNMHRVGQGWQCRPWAKAELNCNYNLMFAPENTYAAKAGFSESGHVRGHLLAAKLNQTFSDCLAMCWLAELFLPGDYYDDGRNEPAAFLRWEITMKW